MSIFYSTIYKIYKKLFSEQRKVSTLAWLINRKSQYSFHPCCMIRAWNLKNIYFCRLNHSSTNMNTTSVQNKYNYSVEVITTWNCSLVSCYSKRVKNNFRFDANSPNYRKLPFQCIRYWTEIRFVVFDINFSFNQDPLETANSFIKLHVNIGY